MTCLLVRALDQSSVTPLAKLRPLFVIAQGTVFTLHERPTGAQEAGRILDVDCIVSGSARSHGGRLTVTVELAETRSARIVWSEIFNHKLDDAILILDASGNGIVASGASEIEALERDRAVLKPPNSLDAGEACHRGLWHMYRHRKADDDKARYFFPTEVHLDPTFSRAYAGLSLTHFGDALQNWKES